MHLNLELTSLLPTFVPAGFVDVGHSVVRDASTGKNLVIVDSVQSLANHIEATLIQQPGEVIDGLEAMPYVRLTITDPAGRTRTTSSLELPHRLASGWFCKAKELKRFQEDLATDILDNGIAAATFRRCPNSLLHGVFYSQLANLNPNISKSPRLLSAEVVAIGAQSTIDGGVSRDPLTIKGDFDWEAVFAPPEKGSNKPGESKVSTLGVGYITHRHQSFIAERIELAIYLAEGRIDQLQLPDSCKHLLRSLAMFKLATLLSSPLDLRAHCILQVKNLSPELSNPMDLLDDLKEKMLVCTNEGLFADPAVQEFSLVLPPARHSKKSTTKESKGDEEGLE